MHANLYFLAQFVVLCAQFIITWKAWSSSNTVSFNRFMKEQAKKADEVKIIAFITTARTEMLNGRKTVMAFSNAGKCPISVVQAHIEDRRTSQAVEVYLKEEQFPFFLVPGGVQFVEFAAMEVEDDPRSSSKDALVDSMNSKDATKVFYVRLVDSRKNEHEIALA